MSGSGDELLKLLKARELADPILMNPKRFLIVTTLYMIGTCTMGFLQKALNLTWGDLYTHVKKLESAGYVKTRRILTLSGPRIQVRLTDEGMKNYVALLRTLREISDEIGGYGED